MMIIPKAVSISTTSMVGSLWAVHFDSLPGHYFVIPLYKSGLVGLVLLPPKITAILGIDR